MNNSYFFFNFAPIMKEFVISEAKAETAVLVGLITQQQDEAKTKEYLDELEFLADTAGAVTVKRFTQKVQGPSQVTYVGKGKLEEIRQYIKQKEDAYYDWLDAGSPEPEDGQEVPQPVGMVGQDTGGVGTVPLYAAPSATLVDPPGTPGRWFW